MSGDPALGLVFLPVESATGDRYGGNRPGANVFASSTVALDPETGRLYVPSRTATSVLSLVNDPTASSVRSVHGGDRTHSIDGIPLVKPPYGRITAIALVSGQHLWQTVIGETPA